MCKIDGCKIQPTYNYEGQSKALYCVTHKLEGMVDVKSKACIHPGCNVQPCYNVEGELNVLYCATHKLEGMVNVRDKRCIHPGCKIRPNYNIEGAIKSLYCATHKLNGMVNVKSKTCIHPGCRIQPVYNIEGETKAIYCASHKIEGMVNVRDKTCIHPGCKIRSIYNNDGETKGLYCVKHKITGMINITDQTCIHPGCKIRPGYNMEGETKALYCSAHKKERMVDVKNKRCKSDWCFTHVQEKYEGYCLFCFMNLFPDKPVSRNYKTKEYAVVEFVKDRFSSYDWITDRIISGGCSKRRPDLLLDLGYQIIIVEVDENQHIDYDCSCENKRIMQLSQDVGHRPIVFIRFNPDDYVKDHMNITSCWTHDKRGICVVKKSKKDEWIQRLHELEEQITYWTNPENTTDKTVEIIQLFYDV